MAIKMTRDQMKSLAKWYEGSDEDIKEEQNDKLEFTYGDEAKRNIFTLDDVGKGQLFLNKNNSLCQKINRTSYHILADNEGRLVGKYYTYPNHGDTIEVSRIFYTINGIKMVN